MAHEQCWFLLLKFAQVLKNFFTHCNKTIAGRNEIFCKRNITWPFFMRDHIVDKANDLCMPVLFYQPENSAQCRRHQWQPETNHNYIRFPVFDLVAHPKPVEWVD